MTTATLKAEWNRVKKLRQGPYAGLSTAQQAGALLSSMSMWEATQYCTKLITNDTGYWVDVRNLLFDAC